MHLRAYRPWQRACAGALVGCALAALLGCGGLVLLDLVDQREAPRLPLPYLVRALFFAALLPLLAARAVRLLCGATARVEGDKLFLSMSTDRYEIPIASIAGMRPRFPLPEPLAALSLRSGRTFELTLAADDPAALARALGQPDAPFADASARFRLRLLRHPLIALVLVPAIVSAIVFRLHQIIVYGGLFGEAYARGWSRWLHTLAGVCLHTAGHLALYFAALRVLTEGVCLAARRARVRAVAEWTSAAAYYGPIAAALLLRLG